MKGNLAGPIYRTPAEYTEHIAKDDEWWAAQHRVKVRFQPPNFQGVCSCSWTGPWVSTRAAALACGHTHQTGARRAK